MSLCSRIACRSQFARSSDAHSDSQLLFLPIDTIFNALTASKLSAEPRNDTQIHSTVRRLENLLSDNGGGINVINRFWAQNWELKASLLRIQCDLFMLEIVFTRIITINTDNKKQKNIKRFLLKNAADAMRSAAKTFNRLIIDRSNLIVIMPTQFAPRLNVGHSEERNKRQSNVVRFMKNHLNFCKWLRVRKATPFFFS